MTIAQFPALARHYWQKIRSRLLTRISESLARCCGRREGNPPGQPDSSRANPGYNNALLARPMHAIDRLDLRVTR
jgi:hypothetical protein